eukprot:TRINITY_DN4858_c0_g1_i12.p1 TRINITY_DN4858_c0_g1~~TRINITY_DN4858_c0_g1_i12.p1  ORF type:complete len:758 (-),score=265.01 TRINITY_DN4858_c0_g1_i12:256-2529(-)
MHDNLGHLLIEIIRGSRDFLLSATAQERFHNSLLNTAENKDICESLIDVMVCGPARESVIVNIVSVLLCLLEVRKPMNMEHGFSTAHDQGNSQTTADIQHQEEIVVQTVQLLVPRLPQIVNLLANPPVKKAVTTTAGTVDPPFGAARLAICKLLSTLLNTRKQEVNSGLAATPFLNTLLQLFFHYTLNNFLHSQTASTIVSILDWEPLLDLNVTLQLPNTNPPPPTDSLQTPKIETENPMENLEKEKEAEIDDLDINENPLLVQLFTEARMLERLVETWERADNDPKISYMGHITQISNRLVEAMTEKDGETAAAKHNRLILTQIFQKQPEELVKRWEEIVSDKLSSVNTKNEIKSYRDKHSSDDDSDFRDIQFPQDTTLQQFMNDNLEDTFGFTTEDFNSVEESYGKMTASDSCLVVTDETKKAIFEKICSAQGSCDSDDDEDIWADKTAQITFGEPTSTLSKSLKEEEEHSSEEEGEGEEKMEVDQDPWSMGTSEAPVAMDTSAPWDTTPAAPPATSSLPPTSSQGGGGGGWANFDSGTDDGTSTTQDKDANAFQGGEGWASFDATPTATTQQQQGDDATTTTQQQQTFDAANKSSQDENNWADFSSLDAAGGEGFGSCKLGEKTDDWRPAMSSSPEATMLDQFEDRLTQAGPLRPGSPDLANTNANHAPSDFNQQQREEGKGEGEGEGDNNANETTTAQPDKSADLGGESADLAGKSADDAPGSADQGDEKEEEKESTEDQKIRLDTEESSSEA